MADERVGDGDVPSSGGGEAPGFPAGMEEGVAVVEGFPRLQRKRRRFAPTGGGNIPVLFFLLMAPAFAQAPVQAPDSGKEAAYTKTIQQRADKIVETLGIGEPSRAGRVRDLIAQEYRDLRTIQDAREPVDATKKKQDTLHQEFLRKLSAELTPEQVDKVKDGMTYGVLPLTYRVYLEMYPDLTPEQKTQIRAYLTEARENAMDAGTSKEKHAWFGKYKGRINNYLSHAGYDLKKAEKAFTARQKASAPGTNP